MTDPKQWHRWQDVLDDPRRLPDVDHGMRGTVRDYAVCTRRGDAVSLEHKLVRLLALCITGAAHFAVREPPHVSIHSDGTLECRCRVWFGERADYDALVAAWQRDLTSASMPAGAPSRRG